jgi:hypothetical protein
VCARKARETCFNASGDHEGLAAQLVGFAWCGELFHDEGLPDVVGRCSERDSVTVDGEAGCAGGELRQELQGDVVDEREVCSEPRWRVVLKQKLGDVLGQGLQVHRAPAKREKRSFS